jgi:enoyl-CoA hydratase
MSASSGSDAVTVEQERLDESAAMANEFGHGMTSLAVDALPGAARFAAGWGRHAQGVS